MNILATLNNAASSLKLAQKLAQQYFMSEFNLKRLGIARIGGGTYINDEGFYIMTSSINNTVVSVLIPKI